MLEHYSISKFFEWVKKALIFLFIPYYVRKKKKDF